MTGVLSLLYCWISGGGAADNWQATKANNLVPYCLSAVVWYGVLWCGAVWCKARWVLVSFVLVLVFDILHMEIPGLGSQRENTNIIIAGECQPGVKRARLFCRSGQGTSIVMLDCTVLAERGEG
ncbi:hypothetical protein F4803DRAFT_537111 [Xylaria telfairii]|nr:hypothetical protein F4803DRAFT_537111 [Xylaria telfairii]